MSTSMHRLQISIPSSQVNYWTHRAKREGISIAQLLRRLIHREFEEPAIRSTASIHEFIAIGKDSDSLIEDTRGSEQRCLA